MILFPAVSHASLERDIGNAVVLFLDSDTSRWRRTGAEVADAITGFPTA
ncbi:hypothetical protein [Rhizobium sp. LjRoot258]